MKVIMSLEDQIFEKHYDYYKNIGIETIKQQAGQVEQVSSDYQGRVIFELLQNAFDKAEKNILVEVQGNSLYIANDGAKFTYNANHDYEDGKTQTDKFTRYDFQSLCSISTSSKTTSKSIGNKGVGFKSVFSVAKDGVANVYTQGIIVDGAVEKPEIISFGIYDSFKNIDNVPNGFNDKLQQNIIEQIKHVQQERKERGVPGYYYPLHITEEPKYILDYFDKGYVTIIEIPFDNTEAIIPLFEEIKKIHFNFISLKYKNKFDIYFKLNDDSFEKRIETKAGLFFSTIIKKEALEELAINAGIQVGEDNKIAICFKSQEEIDNGQEGLIYNYLPTKQKSPFRYIDFHADFHTSVDRKTIEFGNSSKIGKYNAALLKACVELYFSVIRNSVIGDEKPKLSVKHILIPADKIEQFHWIYFAIDKNEDIYHYVRTILKFDDISINQGNYNDKRRYSTAVQLIASLAKQYFLTENIVETKRIEFFMYVVDFIHHFTNDYKMQYSRSEIFKQELANVLLHHEIRLLPNLTLSSSKEILYRENDDEGISLPSFLGINITSFKIPDDYLSRCLGIKKYSDINVLFKYFRQVSIHAEISSKRLTEQEQKSLLKSLFQVFKNKKEKIDSFTHRYDSFLSELDRKNYSAQNITAFSVSTVFLKTKTDSYKPAQLCSSNELNQQFINDIVDDLDYKDAFLRFLGVSSDQNYLVVDMKIYVKFYQGIEYIPAPFARDETQNLTGKEIIPKIKVISGSRNTHPALINYNRYPFLEDISNTKLRKQLSPLSIGDYNSFPDEYATILLQKLKDNTKRYPQDVFRLYSANCFHLFDKTKNYLVVNQGRYFWTTYTDFKIVQNRNDFELLKNQPINLLCFFNGKEVPEHLLRNIIELKPKGVELNNETDITTDFKTSFEKLIPYILAEISYLNTSISEKDYIANLEEVSGFQKKWVNISVKTGEKLSVIIEFQTDQEPLKLQQKYCMYQNTLYFDNAISDSQKAAAIAKHIFDIGSLSAKVELLFFHIKMGDLVEEYDQKEIELIACKWLPDYEEKFNEFQSDVLSHFDIKEKPNPLWYVYDKSNKSEILIHLESEGRINELIQVVNDYKAKEKFENYFESFNIVIDRSHIENKVGELLLILHKNSADSGLVEELNILSCGLGIENRLQEIEEQIKKQFPELNHDDIFNQEASAKRKEIALQNKVDTIFSKISNLIKKDVTIADLSGNHATKQMPVKLKKIIFQGKALHDSKILETMGASGEEEVLLYFIQEFIAIADIDQRKSAINEVYSLLKKYIGDDSLQKYKIQCLKVIKDDPKLQKALIPLFYVTMHHKYSYFDLIVYYENLPTLVEVKTTTNSNRFYLSIAEVEAARRGDNYLIVRNTSDSINILGNPIKEVEQSITLIQGEKFTLKPRNYEFVLRT